MSETKFKWDRIKRAFSGETTDKLLAEREKKVRTASIQVKEFEKQLEDQEIKGSELQTLAAAQRDLWASVKDLTTNNEKGERLESIKINLRALARLAPSLVQKALEKLESEIKDTRQLLDEAKKQLEGVTHPAMAASANEAKQKIRMISEMVEMQGKIMSKSWLQEQQVQMLDLANSVVSRAGYLTKIDELLSQATVLLNNIKLKEGNDPGRKTQEMESNLMICRRFRDQIVTTAELPSIETLGNKTTVAVQQLIEQFQYKNY